MTSPPIYDDAGAAARGEQPHVARRMLDEALMLFDRGFGALSAALLLAVIATVPVLQLFALGYLVHAAGRYAKTGRFSDAFTGVEEASRVGQIVLGAWLITLPLRLVASLCEDAALIAPGTKQVADLSKLQWGLGVFALWIFVAAVSQGGALAHFFRPLRASRRLWIQARARGFAGTSWRALRGWAAGFGVARMMSLGLRAYAGAFVWLAVPTTLIAVGRKGIVALMGGLLLVAVLVYLPFLQIHFAVHDRFRRMFALEEVRDLHQRAPIAFSFALLSSLLLALPLYLLKIELVPRDALWLPAAVFIATIFPCKLLTAWAYHRGLKRDSPRHGVWIWTSRIAMVGVAIVYAFVVFLTQYTGWHGVLGLYEHHAFLLPVPF